VSNGTKSQCTSRWYGALNARIVGTTVRTGKWTPEEDGKLKDAVQMKDGKNRDAFAGLVPGRTQNQCKGRWLPVLDININCPTGRRRKWRSEEDDMLKNGLPLQGRKDWNAIATLFPGRTRHQSSKRWLTHLDPNCVTRSSRLGGRARTTSSKRGKEEP
jgi:hypothetical protein